MKKIQQLPEIHEISIVDTRADGNDFIVNRQLIFLINQINQQLFLIITTTKNQLTAYFLNQQTTFDVPLDLAGTEFQLKVWNELLKIPFGSTRTYKQQAIAVGNLKAIRAVATANGENRISIIIPCHRVIGSDGSLTGYGGGIWRKQKLLELETTQTKLF
ncbi:MAG: methylated-DNA--[protein]-cysteine S-methyltransferase [Flavobacteriales bacterium]|nr:methylated-DNA--[protein]-cysteine S-methyltransferase [Flavobacteriales bacterium]